MVFTEENIISFVKDETIDEDIQLDTDIFKELACTGDDFHELMGKYSKKFKVDMSAYLWYFHCNEEGQNTGGLFFKPPYKRVQRIPVTPRLMLEMANAGKWTLKYPEHKIPKFRIDLFINLILIIVLIFFIIKSCIVRS